jgi:hypothetical protein
MDTMITPNTLDLHLALTGTPSVITESGQEHAPWCAQHTTRGCLGEELTLSGSRVTVWLSRAAGAEDHLVVDFPGGSLELVIPD